MSTVSNTALIDVLERGRIITAIQLKEVKTVLQQSLRDPQALLRELARRGWLTGYQARQLLSGRGADLVFDRYLLLEPIGAGASGQVYKARHQKMDRLVALKVLRRDLAKDAEIVQRFYREIEVVSQLSHQNIVHAFEAGPIGPLLVLVMEYVDGVDLERLVEKSGPLPVARACDYIRQAACGLAYAHDKGLVHRDIKPSNLLVARDAGRGTRIDGDSSASRAPSSGLIKILDLGLARLQQPAQGSRTANLTIIGSSAVTQGTPDYMAPEQALDFHSADARADIYSLGCTFYFLLTGQPPFPGGSLAEKLMKHQLAPPPSIEAIRKDVSSGLAAVLRTMLAKRPPDRYATAGEAVAALAPLMRTTNVERTLPGTGDSTLWNQVTAAREDGPCRRSAVISRKRVLLAVCGLGALGVLGIIVWLLGSSATTAKGTAVTATSSAVAPVDPSLLGHWHFDEGKGMTAADASGKGSQATLHGGAVWAPGRNGSAVALNGQTAYVDYGTGPAFNFADRAAFTLAGWVQTRAPYGAILSQRNSANENAVVDIMVGKDGGADERGHLMALVRDDIHKGGLARVTGGVVNDGQWHHFALVRTGATISLYLDGAVQGSSTNGAAGGPITTNMRAVGSEREWARAKFAKPDQCYLKGLVADVRIYNRALSAAEVAALRSSQLAQVQLRR